MKHAVVWSVILLVLGGWQRPAQACTCGQVQRDSNLGVVQEALNDATFVFVAKVREVRHSDRVDYYTPLGPRVNVTEDARFVVLEVLKGDLYVGQPVMFRNVYSPGSCALTARNDPLWIEEIVVAGEETIPAKISDTWLIFANGREPFELHRCSRTAPLDFTEPQLDLGFLRELQKKVPWQPPTVSPPAKATSAAP